MKVCGCRPHDGDATRTVGPAYANLQDVPTINQTVSTLRGGRRNEYGVPISRQGPDG
jgi:hypothetical protein